METSWSELIWAAITIGRPNVAYVFQYGYPSYHEAVFRLSLIRMALTQKVGSESLFRTEAFRYLDPTEKGAISYFLGMTVCKLFASKLLSTPWLLHLDVFRDQLNPTVLRDRSRPDLVGQDINDAWYAFESKGRSSVPSLADKEKAKAQATRLVSVDSIKCSLNIGAISYFKKDELEFYWRDPDPEEARKLEPIKVQTPEKAWSTYYMPALALDSELGSERTVDNRMSFDVEVGIHPKIRELLLKNNWNVAHSLAKEMRTDLEQEGFHPDGLKVIAGDSWPQPYENRQFPE